MKKIVYNISFLFFSMGIILSPHFGKPKPKPVIIAYVGGFRGIDQYRLDRCVAALAHQLCFC